MRLKVGIKANSMKSTQTSGSGLWKHGLLITLLFGFTVMLAGGFFMYKTRAPIPSSVVAPNGTVLFSGADIQAGQELFRKRDLMNYGSILGHGAYLGPDYTAEALHWMTEAMQDAKSRGSYATLGIAPKAAFAFGPHAILGRIVPTHQLYAFPYVETCIYIIIR